MAKYTITHTDGVEATYQIIGPYRERARRIEWLESQPSPEGQARARDEANEAAAAANAASGLVALTGSPKQIAWAETIRAGQIDQMRALKKSIIDHDKSLPYHVQVQLPEIADKMIARLDAWIATTDAGDWIDRRRMTVDAHTLYDVCAGA